MQSAPSTANGCVSIDLAGPAGQERLANLEPVASEDESWKNWSTTRVDEVREGDTLYLWVRFRGGIEFLVDRAGTGAWAWWPESIGYDEAVSYLIGPILGTILRLRGATVQSHHDHRLAMALALVGLVVPGVVVSDPGVVAKSWPSYWTMLAGLAG